MARSNRRISSKLGIVQISAAEAAVFDVHSSNFLRKFSAPAPIKGVDVCSARALIWTASEAYIFQLDSDKSVSFTIPVNSSLVINDAFVFQKDQSSVKVLTHEAVLKSLLLLDDYQGEPVCLDCTEEYLTVMTRTGCIRLWRLEDTDIKPCGPGSRCKVITSVSNISMRINCNGTKLSFLVSDNSNMEPRLYFFDLVLDKVFNFDSRSLRRRIPADHCWDTREPRLLACEMIPENSETGEKEENNTPQVEILFATSDHGLLSVSKVEADDRRELLGISTPYMHFTKKCGSEAELPDDSYERKTMPVFQNLEELDCATQSKILSFHLYIVLGNTNEAYKILENIQDKTIWENLAKFYIKTRLIDPARFCLAKMQGEVIGLTSVETNELSSEASLAALAVQLGLFDDAESFYLESKRYDLLNLFHQMRGNWDKAIQVASKYDFAHLKSTHHAYAKHLESIGNIKAATKHYELSDTHRFEVPRMLFSLQLLDELESYVKRSKDSALKQWWAHFCEANDNLQKAIEYYTAAGDIASVVRVYCYLNEFKAAAEVASHYSDNSATFQLARQYERNGNIQEALQFFMKSGRFGHAAKLAMKNGIDTELLSLSLQSSKDVMILAANYFERKGRYQEAVLLYQKGGNLERAVDICIRSQLFDALKAIADDLDEAADPALLSRCGDFLMSHNQVEKAVVLYVAAKQHDRALELCIKEGVTITDKLADQFTSNAADVDPEKSRQMITTLAECCEEQGLFHLACKKYTQAGDSVMAMKALIKSGDTERIVLFANASRQKQLYTLTADYLQTLDWHEDPSLMRTIVQMYTKAGEVDSVAGFYESCAQIEIDEFRDYEKALGAMKEALKYASKSTRDDKHETINSLQLRISEIDHFVKARRMAKGDPAGLIRACNELIAHCSNRDESEAGVRVGDLYALLVEYYFSQGNLEQVYNSVEKMKLRDIDLDPYIDEQILTRLSGWKMKA